MHHIVLIGAGQRGMAYARALADSGRVRIAAVAEPHPGRREAAREAFGLRRALAFERAEDLLAGDPLGDAAIIASLDRDHYAQAMAAMDAGYELLLEKPISPDPAECMGILEKARSEKRRVLVCHVLRYAPFFRELHRLAASGEWGRPLTIQHSEGIGNFHMAHSFVRGNWASSERSSPIILQKSCHDMDLLTWYADSAARTVSSFGRLSYFRIENAPAGSAERCLDCPVASGCRFDARKVYLPAMGRWPASVLTLDQSEEGLLRAFREGPYGRCVYRCDNDVCDHQVTCVEFENGVTATFSLSAFTDRISRSTRIMCEHGEICGSEYENLITVTPFASTRADAGSARVFKPAEPTGGHAGGDEGIVREFLRMLDDPSYEAATTIETSVESHFMASAAEASRLRGETVRMDAYRVSLASDAP